MSVKGFRFNDVVHKYDYDSLDNIPTPDKTLTKDGEAADSKTVGDAITTLHHLVGTPLVASSAASMTDRTKIYVYTGSETGYVNGHWYYFDGTSWADGGVYNSTALETDKTLTVENTAADAKKTGDSLDDLKSALNTTFFADGCPYIKELYINEAGRSAGVDKLHSVYIPNSGTSTAYFIRFCNSAGTAYTGHTSDSATPPYGVTPIYSGMSGQDVVYGYVIFDWEKITANLSLLVALNEKSYHIDFSPKIASALSVEPIADKLEYSDYNLVPNTFALIATDYNLNNVVDSANRFATTDAFFCKGKVRIYFDSSIVGIGLRLYVMSMQSGRNSQYAVNIALDESSYTFELNDTVRVAVFNANGIAPQYNTVISTTKIYTLSDGVYFDYLNNSIIGVKKIWCFGDSLTAGVITGRTTIAESYPYWLKKFLGNDNADITNYGVPGDTAVNMLSVISNKTFYGNCDIAIIMIGTNGYMNGDATDPTTPLGAYYASIEHIINSGKGTVKIVLMNPPKSIRTGVPARWLDCMHYEEQAIAEHFNLDMIDLYTLLPFDPNNTTYYSSDKTHLTAIGYYYIAYIVHQYLVTHMTAQQVGGNPTFDY